MNKHGIPVGMSRSFFSKVMYYCTNNIAQQFPFTFSVEN